MKLKTWRLLYIKNTLLKQIYRSKLKKLRKNNSFSFKHSCQKEFKIASRASYITPLFLNSIVHIYNGKLWKKAKINFFMIGKKFGDISITRKFFDKGQNSPLKKKRKRPKKARILLRKKNFLSKKKYRVRSITSLHIY